MKICIVPTMFPKYKGDYYGSFVYDEAKKLVENGIEVHVLTQHNHGALYDEVMDGIHVHRFPWLEPKEFRALVHFRGLKDNLRLVTYVISLFFNLIKIIRKNNIKIIHAHSVIPTGFIGVLVGKIMGLNSIITTHGMDINNFEKKSIYGCLISFSLKNCDKTITVSEDLAENVRSYGLNEDKLVILKNAVDTKLFKPSSNGTNLQLRSKYGIKEKDILILFVGYLDVFKGIFEILEAFHNIKKANKNVKLLIVGTGPQERDMKRKVLELNLKRFVFFTGGLNHHDLPGYYQEADIFVLPSYTEGLPLSILEAMSCGLPIITTNVGGIPEIIESGFNGFMVSPQDSNELKEKLEILVNDSNLRSKFGSRSVDLIFKGPLNMETKINTLINLYKF